jgi:hypothetical protein
MEQTDMTLIKEAPERVIVYRAVRAPERYLPNGKYNFKPLSPTYSRDYYHRTKQDVQCEFCQKILCHPARLKLHQKKAKKCMMLRENMSLKEALEATKQLETSPSNA